MIQTASIQITPEILGLIAGIDEFKGAWQALGTLAPDRLSALRRVGDAIRLINGNRNTLKQHFRALVEQGRLGQHGAGRGVWYELR